MVRSLLRLHNRRVESATPPMIRPRCDQMKRNSHCPRPCRRGAAPVRHALLLTAFGAFPGVASNPSAEILAVLAREVIRRPGPPATAFVRLETLWSAPEAALRLARRLRPGTLVHLGVAARRRTLRVELVAANRAVPHPDAAGTLPASPRLSATAGGGLGVGYDARPLVTAARRFAPATLSRDAGGYICNATLFASLAERAAPVVAFIHVPMPAPRRGERIEDLVRAVAAAVAVVAATPRGGGPPRRLSRAPCIGRSRATSP